MATIGAFLRSRTGRFAGKMLLKGPKPQSLGEIEPEPYAEQSLGQIKVGRYSYMC